MGPAAETAGEKKPSPDAGHASTIIRPFDDEFRTLPYGLFTFTTESGSNNEIIMAAATMVVLPMLILFLFARKQIVRGVARGGIKG